MINVINVGASGGLDQPWRDCPDVGVVLEFEPNDPPMISDRQIRLKAAVWSEATDLPLYVSGNRGHGSSFLKQNVEWVKENYPQISRNGNWLLNRTWFKRARITGTERVAVMTLDSAIKHATEMLGRPVPFHFMKSDTQSGEWPVLQGGMRYLREQCLAMELELYRLPLYSGMVLEDEVKSRLANLGFSVAGWTGYQSSFDSQADYLFVRADPRSDGERELIARIVEIYSPLGSNRVIKGQRMKSLRATYQGLRTLVGS